MKDANQLIKCAVAGLSDHFVVCGMLARAIFFVAIGNLARCPSSSSSSSSSPPPHPPSLLSISPYHLTFASPPASRFMLNTFATRGNLWKIMDDIGRAIQVQLPSFSHYLSPLLLHPLFCYVLSPPPTPSSTFTLGSCCEWGAGRRRPSNTAKARA